MKIIQKKHNVLLGRTDITAEVEHVQQATPKNADVASQIASSLGANVSLIKIKQIISSYGGGNAKVVAALYDTPETFQKIEVIRKKAKKKEGKAAPKKE